MLRVNLWPKMKASGAKSCLEEANSVKAHTLNLTPRPVALVHGHGVCKLLGISETFLGLRANVPAIGGRIRSCLLKVLYYDENDSMVALSQLSRRISLTTLATTSGRNVLR